jgi:methionine-rich copper-binding protein CopC
VNRSTSTKLGSATAARLLVILLGSAAVVVVAGVPASAHNSLVSTTPADGATVARTPATVVLTFDEPAIALGTEVVVTGPTGAVQQGPARLVDNTVSQDLQSGAPAGTYRVAWRVTSADGHPVSGTFTFSARAAGREQPPTATAVPTNAEPAAPSPGGGSGWLWAGVGLVAALIATAIIRRLVRRRPDDTADPAVHGDDRGPLA